MAPEKSHMSPSDHEVDPMEFHLSGKLRKVDSVRSGLTVLALAAGVTILGVSAHAVSVFDSTRIAASFHLPLWPEDFDIRPTVSLVVCGAIITAVSLASVMAGKFFRDTTLLHTGVMLAAPLVAFVAAVISMAFFYAVNASATVETMQSWSCRWNRVDMLQAPYFGTLCAQNQAGLYLSVLLIPLELLILGAAGYQFVLEKQVGPAKPRMYKTNSPMLSS